MASVNVPVKVAIHYNTGDIYISDKENNMIRKMNEANGIITTVAGTGARGYLVDGGLAINAKLYFPEGIAVSESGEVYIADRLNHCIRKVDLNGIITTVAGTPESPGYNGEDGDATAIMLNTPNGVAVMANGALLITDTLNHLIRKVNLNTGQISTFAGNRTGTYNGENILASEATVNYPTDIHVTPSGNIFFLDRDNLRIRKIDDGGVITTVAGNGRSGQTSYDRPANQTYLYNILTGLGVSKEEELFIVDYQNVIKMVNKEGIIQRVAGSGSGFIDNAPALSAKVDLPYGLAVTDTKEIIIADCRNYRVRKFKVGGNMTTIAGTGLSSMNTGSGIAFSTSVNAPRSVALASNGDLFIAEQSNLKKIV